MTSRSFDNLENNVPFVLQKIGFPGFVGVQNKNIGFYVQDDWKVNRNAHLEPRSSLRLQHGVERTSQPGAELRCRHAVTSAGGQDAYNAPKGDFAPRVGFSYDPFGKGKTVIHGYGGLFYMPMQFGFGLVSNIPAYQSYNVNLFQAHTCVSLPQPTTSGRYGRT